MDKEKLYELLDIETPEDFQYFENFAALVEYDEEIPYELICELVKEVDLDTLSGLCDEYFDEISDHIPDGETDVYVLLEDFKRNLQDLREDLEEDARLIQVADVLDSFRKFYAIDSKVYVTDLASGEESTVTLAEALVLSRMESLNINKYKYDFRDCING